MTAIMRLALLFLIGALALNIHARSLEGSALLPEGSAQKLRAKPHVAAVAKLQAGPKSSVGNCPSGWLYFQSTNRCFIQISKSYPFQQALNYCRAMGTDLASIHNAFENNFIASSFSGNDDGQISTFAYVGLYAPNNDGNWTWTDGTLMSYSNWVTGTAPNNGQPCGVINTNTTTGKWYTDPANLGNYFICAVASGTPIITPTPPPTPPPGACPSNWVYYASSTGSKRCYMQVNSIAYNFQASTSYCRNLGGDLVSIHSADEDNFLSTTFSGNQEQYEVSPFAMIGLYSPNNDTNWKWTDGTPLDYQNWVEAGESGYPNAVLETNIENGQWYYDNNGSPNYFICARKANV